VTATAGRWVGQAVLRVEDEALLRGQGRFMDDIEPAAHARHAAVVRSPFAHARIGAIDVSAALAVPGVVGVLTGEDVAALSRPFPAGIETGVPCYSAAVGTARYAGEPVAVVVASSRYVAEDAAELVLVDYDPLEPEELQVHERAFSYGAVDEAFEAADVVVRGRFPFPRWSCTPVECFGVVADWRGDSLTAWANFQGPFTLHSVAAAALGLKGSKLRLIPPPDSGGSFGIKSSVFAYVVLVGLAAKNARNQTNNRVGNNRRWQFAARQNIVPDRDPLVDVGVNALVEAFIVTGQENEPRGSRKTLGDDLSEAVARRRHHDDARVGAQGFDRLNRRHHRFRL